MERKTVDHLSQEHVEVRAEMKAIEADLAQLRESAPTASFEPLCTRLRAFRDHLQQHFREEERSGLFGSPRDQDLDTRMRVDKLLMQHREFLREFDRIVADLEGASPTADSIDACAKEVDHLFANLRWHDSMETGLMARFASGGR